LRYVQDVRYDAVPWMAKSGVCAGCMFSVLPKSGYAQDVCLVCCQGAHRYRMYGRFLLRAKTAFPTSIWVV